jgi:hypothetical protein
MKICYIYQHKRGIQAIFKMLTKKSSGAFWYFNEASPIPSTHFWKDFALEKEKMKIISFSFCN